jgi:hypothetical protein
MGTFLEEKALSFIMSSIIIFGSRGETNTVGNVFSLKGIKVSICVNLHASFSLGPYALKFFF